LLPKTPKPRIIFKFRKLMNVGYKKRKTLIPISKRMTIM